MKLFQPIFLLVLLLFSCTEKKEKYYGEWMAAPMNWDRIHADRLTITKDSIFISEFPYSNYYSEKLQLKNSRIKILNNEFKIRVKNDSILELNETEFIKKGYQYYNDNYFRKMLTIDYPELDDIHDKIDSQDNSNSHIYFGKLLNSSKYGLQLNDRISEGSQDLRWFLMHSRPIHDYRYSVLLYADKESKMKDVNTFFRDFKATNHRRVYLVNDQEFIVKNDTAIIFETYGIPLRLSYIEEENLFFEENYPKIPLPPDSSLRE